jgi:hypothetical protein
MVIWYRSVRRGVTRLFVGLGNAFIVVVVVVVAVVVVVVGGGGALPPSSFSAMVRLKGSEG